MTHFLYRHLTRLYDLTQWEWVDCLRDVMYPYRD